VGVKRVALSPAVRVDENGQGYISEEVKQRVWCLIINSLSPQDSEGIVTARNKKRV
jgi:hypothetical protein